MNDQPHHLVAVVAEALEDLPRHPVVAEEQDAHSVDAGRLGCQRE